MYGFGYPQMDYQGSQWGGPMSPMMNPNGGSGLPALQQQWQDYQQRQQNGGANRFNVVQGGQYQASGGAADASNPNWVRDQANQGQQGPDPYAQQRQQAYQQAVQQWGPNGYQGPQGLSQSGYGRQMPSGQSQWSGGGLLGIGQRPGGPGAYQQQGYGRPQMQQPMGYGGGYGGGWGGGGYGGGWGGGGYGQSQGYGGGYGGQQMGYGGSRRYSY